MIDVEIRKIEIATQFSRMMSRDFADVADRTVATRLWIESFASGMMLLIMGASEKGDQSFEDLLEFAMQSIRKKAEVNI